MAPIVLKINLGFRGQKPLPHLGPLIIVKAVEMIFIV